MTKSSLISQITFKNGTDTRLTTTKQYDYLSRLLQTASIPSASGELPVSFGYGHNPANQRVRATLADGSYWLYRYDSLGQVISGKRYWSDHTPVAGQQFEYAFDDIGNRYQTKTGGDANGVNLRTASYTADVVNQYIQRTVPGAVDILGLAAAAAAVTVNGDANVYRRGEYYEKTVSLDNTNAGPVLASISVTATLAGYSPQTQTGNYFLPSTPEYYTPDEDGNTWVDGRWFYTWDGENRLIEAELWVAVPDPAKRRLTFTYDDRGRRLRKQVYTWASGQWQLATERKFLYDGWNLVAILDAQSSILQSFVWGMDLSGTLTGAGGVGGLLSMTDYQPGTAGTYFYAYDGNGNVAGLVNAADGKVAAAYEYGPFGEVIRASGPLARVNPFRFSTKYQDEETGFLYYGYRYYNPSTGRWLSRDPIEEQGGLSLYEFVNNSPIAAVDMDGLRVLPIPRPVPIPRPPPTPRPVPGPFPVPDPSDPRSGDLNNPTRSWTDASAGTEIEKMRNGSRQRAFDACYELARRRPGQNQYFYARASFQRAMGAAAVLWKKDRTARSPWAAPGFRAALHNQWLSVERGHLIPAVYGGKADAENVVTQERGYNRGRFDQAIRRRIDAFLPFDGAKCNWVCVVVIPEYTPRWKPVPLSFEMSLIHTFNSYQHFRDSQPFMDGNLDYDVPPWRDMGLGFSPLNYQVLQAGL